MPTEPDQQQLFANCRRVLRMISSLHLRGYQRLRMVPHLYPLGTWRCGITWLDNIRSDHGALACNWDFSAMPQYTSAARREVFGWNDGGHVTPGQLAEMFLQRFPEVAARGQGKDWEYAGWFSWMLHETFPDCLPVASGEDLVAPPGGLVTIGARYMTLAPPPVGRCSTSGVPAV